MSDQVLPEWGIQLRNMVDRMVPVVNDHHVSVEQLENDKLLLEKKVALLEQTTQRQEQTINRVLAMVAGTGPTT